MEMKATGSLEQEYRTYAVAHFQLHGKSYSLPVYQSKSLMNKPESCDPLMDASVQTAMKYQPSTISQGSCPHEPGGILSAGNP